MDVGEKWLMHDCSSELSCLAAGANATKVEKKCSEYAYCSSDEEGTPYCQCYDGFFGDGYKCESAPTIPDDDDDGDVCNPQEKPFECCRKPLTCSCYGDPHCKSFDGDMFDFQGACKYILASTYCGNKTLPDALVPFEIRQKQERRGKSTRVAFIRYVEIDVFDTEFRLVKSGRGQNSIEVDGVSMPIPYRNAETNITITKNGGQIVFSTKFGLTIFWDGKQKAEVSLCEQYARHTCGLCGNGDGNSDNDYVDPQGKPIEIGSKFFNRHHVWGSTWRVPDDSEDANQILCDPKEDPGQPEEPECADIEKYAGAEWCGAVLSENSPWTQCLFSIQNSFVEGLIKACLIDMCEQESESEEEQHEYLCRAFEQLTSNCLASNPSLDINWRQKFNCSIPCGENEEYRVDSKCARSCLDHFSPQAECTLPMPVEGCFCKAGFVLNARGMCVEQSQCGCVLPDGSGLMNIGEMKMLPDCRGELKCQSGPNVTVIEYPPCASAATCSAKNSNHARCVCDPGYFGDGFTCTDETTTPAPPSFDNCDKCGKNAICVQMTTHHDESSESGHDESEPHRYTCVCPVFTYGDPFDACFGAYLCRFWSSSLMQNDFISFDNLTASIRQSGQYELLTSKCAHTKHNSQWFSVIVSVIQREDTGELWTEWAELRIVISGGRVHRYRFHRFEEDSSNSFTVNGVPMSAPFRCGSCEDGGIEIVHFDHFKHVLVVKSKTGAWFHWDGVHARLDVLIGDYDANSMVCGLCGNADGKAENDLRDRANWEANVEEWIEDWRV